MSYHFNLWDLDNLAYPPRVRWEDADWLAEVWDSVQLGPGFRPELFQPGAQFASVADWLRSYRGEVIPYGISSPMVAITVDWIRQQMAAIGRTPPAVQLDSERTEDLTYRHHLIAKELGVPWYTDTLHHIGQYEGACRVSSWNIVQGGLNGQPLKIAMRAQLAHAHRRVSSPDAEIWSAPHLGYDGYRVGDQRYRRATPPDVLTMSLWLSLCTGCQGGTFWGQHCLLPALNPDHYVETWTASGRLPKPVYFPEEGQRVYQQLRDFRALTRQLGDLTDHWRPMPARIAVLYPDVHPDDVAAQARRNLHYAALLIGEPVEVVFLRDWPSGYMDHVEVVLLAWELSSGTSAADSIERWIRNGGRLLDATRLPALTWLAASANDHHSQLRDLAEELASTIGGGTLSGRDFVHTRLSDSEAEYLTVVNAAIEEGPECDWWAGLNGGKRVLFDRGRQQTWRNNSRASYVDILTKKLLASGASVDVPPGQGIILMKMGVDMDAEINKAILQIEREHAAEITTIATDAILDGPRRGIEDVVRAAVRARVDELLKETA